MVILRQVGNSTNTPTNEYIVESQAELDELKETAPFGSCAIMVTEEHGLVGYVLNSSKKWVEVE